MFQAMADVVAQAVGSLASAHRAATVIEIVAGLLLVGVVVGALSVLI